MWAAVQTEHFNTACDLGFSHYYRHHHLLAQEENNEHNIHVIQQLHSIRMRKPMFDVDCYLYNTTTNNNNTNTNNN